MVFRSNFSPMKVVGMASQRDTYKYHLKQGKKVLYRGITNDLARREREHKERFPNSHIDQVGHKTTRVAALKWERAGGKRPHKE